MVGLKYRKDGSVLKCDAFHSISAQQEVSSFALPLCFKEITLVLIFSPVFYNVKSNP